jgi:hypothetical protein
MAPDSDAVLRRSLPKAKGAGALGPASGDGLPKPETAP